MRKPSADLLLQQLIWQLIGCKIFLIYHSVWSFRPKKSFMVTMMRAAVWRSYFGRTGQDSGLNVWNLWSAMSAPSISLQSHGWRSSEEDINKQYHSCPRGGQICHTQISSYIVVTWQISISQVAQAEQYRVQQTLAADWGKSRKFKELNDSLSVLVHTMIRRDSLGRRKIKLFIRNGKQKPTVPLSV